MTINKALERVKALYEPSYADQILTDWLWELDQRLLREEFLRMTAIEAYDAQTDGDVTLIVPPPWDRLYILYLTRMIHYHRGEYEEAANFEIEYNALLREYLAHLLNDLPRGPRGEPWLELPLQLRAGTDFRARMFALPPDATGAVVKLAKAGVRVQTWTLGVDEALQQEGSGLVLHLTADQTAGLVSGGYQIYASVTRSELGDTPAAPIALRVLPAYALEEDDDE